MDFLEMLKQEKGRYEVFLGYNENKTFKLDLCENSSILITGSTGTSKSILMHQALLQLIYQLKENIKVVPISFTKVELQRYADTKYSDCALISDKENAIKELRCINNVILERKKLFLENNVDSFKDYIKINNLPFIVVAIDEASVLFEDQKAYNEILKIINECNQTGVAIIVNTNNVYNDFFEKNINMAFNTKISFDFSDKEQALLNNINNSQNLELGSFLAIKEKNTYEYKIYDFDEKYMDIVLN
ncbi:MAG: hypothetical protein IKE75_00680 [Bacilli bacterium]|nr:hypothetical protein [Bacilli bacterium]